MSSGRKKQATQFSRFVMKLIISGGLLIALAINIAACARKDVGELVTRKPNFVLEEFFLATRLRLVFLRIALVIYVDNLG